MSINDREYGSGSTKWTIHRNWQRRSHKTKNKNQTKTNTNRTQCALDTTILKQTQITLIRQVRKQNKSLLLLYSISAWTIITKPTPYDISGKLIYHKIGMHSRSGSLETGKPHTHTINVNKTCALQQTTGKTGTKHRLCEIDVNITNGVIFFTYHEQYYIDIHVQI
jgi:hypothetical protein